MKTLCALVPLLLTINFVWAQPQPYGQVDDNQLKITECPFEKNASAMVLFDVSEVRYHFESIYMKRHRRIKIFNQKGTEQGDIKLEYLNHNDELITDLQAETVNLENGKTVYTPVDKKNIYVQAVDKYHSATVFSFPNVKPGSIIEYSYLLSTPYPYNYPDWEFQGDIPTQFSQFDAEFDEYPLGVFKKGHRKFVIDSAVEKNPKKLHHIWAMKDVPSFKEEQFTPASEADYQSIRFREAHLKNTWADIGKGILNDVDFGGQMNRTLPGEEPIIAQAKALKSVDEQIAYLFNTVRNTMTWNKTSQWYTIDGTRKAWTKKTGNATEINLILYHLLTAVGVQHLQFAIFSTSAKNQVMANYPSYYNLKKTALVCSVDSTHQYVLDASGKRNSYNDIPVGMLGTYALTIDPAINVFGVTRFNPGEPTTDITYVEADILPSGNLKGTALLSTSSYTKQLKLGVYDLVGEKAYKDAFKAGNNQLDITSIKLENTDVDTLPLKESLDFKQELTGSDDKFIYFSPNIFTGIGANPFSSDTRLNSIDFKYLSKVVIDGRYKIPEGYKVESHPESMMVYMPDKSITFKRVAGEMDGYVIVNYVINYKRATYDVAEYPELHEFYKKMFELLNEQIVLKKS